MKKFIDVETAKQLLFDCEAPAHREAIDWLSSDEIERQLASYGVQVTIQDEDEADEDDGHRHQ